LISVVFGKFLVVFVSFRYSPQAALPIKTVSKAYKSSSADCAYKRLSWAPCCRPVGKHGYVVVERRLWH